VKVLVTGGTGFTGSHTVRALLAAGHEVRLLVRDPAKVRAAFEPDGLIPDIPDDIVVGDMTDAAAVDEALAGCDGVVHAAALVDLSRAAARLVEESNARGVELVIGGAVRRGLPRIVHVSSLGAFFTPGGPPLCPELPIAPGTTAYARSKAHAERYVRRLQEQGAPIRISYPAAIAGPNDPTMSTANNGVRAHVRDLGIITSTGFQVVDVRDLALLHLKLLELPDGLHRYAAAGKMLSHLDYFHLLDSLIGHRVRRIRVPGGLLRAAGSAADALKRFYDFDFPLTRDMMEFMTRWPDADAERTTRELGLHFRDAAETYRDTLIWMYQAGHLGAGQIGRLAEPDRLHPSPPARSGAD
jgi:dihydroflavonol-4-reductase